jgi:lipid II:glycine glycyltransferase (peptidoglycan interpeptide bridge formation enzyme)
MEVQQSHLYAQYIKRLKWNAQKLDGQYVYLKHFPMLGTTAKLQRFERLPDAKKTIAFLHENKVTNFAPEPASGVAQRAFSSWINKISPHTRMNHSHFLPTKTILIGLTKPEPVLFQNLSEAKRRAVRRAQKLGVTIHESDDIRSMLSVKSRSAGLFGFMVVTAIPPLWQTFAPGHATIMLARHSSSPNPIGGILLLFWNKRAYYWLVGATKQGKKLFVPTLLVWEALKVSKKRGMKEFDFLGVNDERLPKDNPSWHGFTKFKEGFGGKSLYYPTIDFA